MISVADDFNSRARQLARMTVDEMQNRGLGLNVHEVRSVLAAVDSDTSEFYCVTCGASLSSDELKSKCGRCGSFKATDQAPFRCANGRCRKPVCLKEERCKACGSAEAIRANGPVISTRGNPSVGYTCKDCLRPVSLKQPSCSCGSTEAYRTVVR